MGKIFIYGRARESNKIDPRARLTISGPPNVEICVTSVATQMSRIATTDASGVAYIDGLPEGLWVVSFVDPDIFTTAKFEIESLDYDITMKYFEATVNVVYPEGSICTCSNGEITIPAHDTSGECSFLIPFPDEWTIACTNGERTETVAIDDITDGETRNIELEYFEATINVVYPKGSTCTCVCTDDDFSIPADNDSGIHSFTIPYAGTWVVGCTDGGLETSKTVVMNADGQTESVELYYKVYLFRNGDTCDSVTGGWGSIVGSENASCTIGDSLTINSADDENAYSCVFTNGSIELSRYSKLVLSFSLTSLTTNGSLTIGIVSEAGTDDYIVYHSRTSETDDLQDFVINIPDTVTTGYIQVALRAGVFESNNIYLRRD